MESLANSLLQGGLDKIIYSKKSGVYRIFCTQNGKSYIGSARNINKRLKAHIRMLKDNTHINSELQNDWNSFNMSDFNVQELIHCSVDRLNECELLMMDKFDSVCNGYNKIKQGHSKNVGIARANKDNPMYGKKHTKEAKEKISEFRKGHKGWKHTDQTKKKQSSSAYERWSKTPKKKYRARIMIDKVDYSLGSYATKEERDDVIRRFKEEHYK